MSNQQPYYNDLKGTNQLQIKKRVYDKLIQDYPNLKVTLDYSDKEINFDLFFSDLNIGVDINDLYWHQYHYEDQSKIDFFKAKNYHYKKFLLAKEKHIQLVQLWEDDLVLRFDFIYRLLISKLGLLERIPIYARKCNVIRVDGNPLLKRQTTDMFNENHLKGRGTAPIMYGLQYVDQFGFGEIIAGLNVSIGKEKTINGGCHDLDRYAANSRYHIHGGFQKLVKFAEKDLNIQKWFTYADNDLSWGNLYMNNGWTQINCEYGAYFYVWKNRRVSRINFQRHKFALNPDLKSQDGYTETQLAQLNELWRIYDSGVSRFEKIVR